MRSAQNFDPIEIGEILVGHTRMCQEDAVDEYADGRLESIVTGRLAEPAKGDACAPGVRSRGFEPGRLLRQVLNADGAVTGERIGLDYGDRNRNVLGGLLAITGGDDDLAQAAVASRIIGSIGAG